MKEETGSIILKLDKTIIEILKNDFSLNLSRKQYRKYLKEYSTFKKPLDETLKEIIKNIKPFYSFIVYNKENNEILKMKEKNFINNNISDIEISDHAIIRYLERIENVNIEEIKIRILSEQTKKQYSILGDGKYPINNEYFVIIRDNKVITIMK